MNRTLSFVFAAIVVLQCVKVNPVHAAALDNNASTDPESSVSSLFAEEVIVESTLNVRKKSGTRQGRTGSGITLETASRQVAPKKVDGSTVLYLRRPKRQGRRRHPNFGQGNGFPQQGFPQQGFPQQGFPQQQFGQFQPLSGSASNAAAQAQGFQSNSPFGSFGASAANAGSQGFSYDQNGIRGNAGLSGSQSYNLPNGNTLAISYANGFSIGPDGRPTITKGNSIAYTGSDGRPIPGFAQDPIE